MRPSLGDLIRDSALRGGGAGAGEGPQKVYKLPPMDKVQDEPPKKVS